MRYFFKKSLPILIILLLSGLVFFGYTYATENLKLFLLRFSEKNFNARLSVGRVGFGFPVCLELNDVKLNNVVDVSSIRIYPNSASFLLKNSLVISRINIIDPVVRIRAEEIEKLGIAVKISAPNFLLSKIYIQNGTLIYDQEKENALEFIKIKGNLESSGFYFSKNTPIRFAATGFFKNRGSDFLSPLSINGYLEPDDIIKAKLYVSDIKVSALGYIYDKYLSRVVEEGRMDFNTDIEISKNNLKAKCFLEGEDIVLKKEPGHKIDTPLIASFILYANFKNKLVKVKNLQSNFLRLILSQS